MSAQEDLYGIGPEPRRELGETIAHFNARRREWLAGALGGATVNAAGIPPAVLPGGSGSSAMKIGEFPLRARGGFPVPTRLAPPAGAELAPFSQDRGPITEGVALASAQRTASGAALGASGSTGGFFGPGGAASAGLRQGVDPTEVELERAFVRATTGYDPAWGVPGDAAGLKWSGLRYLYEPARDQSGLPFQNAADRGFYLQAYQDAALGAGLAGFRWVHTWTAAPTAGRLYSAVGPAESAALWTGVQQYRASMEGNLIGKQLKGEAAFREDPNAPKYVSPYVLPKKPIDIQDYAWIAQKNMPVGCPYPEPYMPVPLEDYTSGYWLSEEYTPSIPLPPPHDQIFWRCSVPSAPGKPHKGGGAPPADFTSSVSISGGGGGGGGAGGGSGEGVRGWGAGVLLGDVGLPPPGGLLVMPGPPPPAPPPPPTAPPKKPPAPSPPTGSSPLSELDAQRQAVEALNAEAERLRQEAAQEPSAGKRSELEAKLEQTHRERDAAQSYLNHLESVEATRAAGGGGYATPKPRPGTSEPGIPPPSGDVGKYIPGSDPSGSGFLHTPRPPQSRDGIIDKVRVLQELIAWWKEEFAELKAKKESLDEARKRLMALRQKLTSIHQNWEDRRLKKDFDKRKLTEGQIQDYEKAKRQYEESVRLAQGAISAEEQTVRTSEESVEHQERLTNDGVEAIRQLTPYDAGSSQPMEQTDPVVIGLRQAGYRASPDDAEEHVNATLRFDSDLTAGVWIDPATGFGMVLKAQSSDGNAPSDYTMDGYGLIFGAIDYDVVGTGYHVQVLTNAGGNPPPHEWSMFLGAVDRDYQKKKLAGAWGYKGPILTPRGYESSTPDNEPVLRSKHIYRPNM